MIRILIVDDQNLVRQGIKSLIDKDLSFEIVGMVGDGRDAVTQVELLRPDIVLLDIEMPKMNGISTTEHISHLAPDTKVIILSSHEDDKYIVQALVAGAKGYILKNSLSIDLKQAILAVNSGYSHIESRLLAKVFNSENITARRQALSLSSNTGEVMYRNKNAAVVSRNLTESSLKLPLTTSADLTTFKEPSSENLLADLVNSNPQEAEVSQLDAQERNEQGKKPHNFNRILLAPSPKRLKSQPSNVSSYHKNLAATLIKAEQYWQRSADRLKQQYGTKLTRFYPTKLSKYEAKILPVAEKWLSRGWVSKLGYVLLGAVIAIILRSL